jgi:hypothetical protein
MRTWELRIGGLNELLAGNATEALRRAVAALDDDALGPNAAQNCWLGVLAGTAAHDPEAVRHVVTLGSGLRGRWLDAARLTAQATMDSGASSEHEVTASWRRALDDWIELGLPLDHAYAVLCCAWTLGAQHAPHDDVATARHVLESLDAVALLRLYDEAGLQVPA